MVDGKFQKVDGSDFELPCELVLLAMGFVGPEKAGLLSHTSHTEHNARTRSGRDARAPYHGLEEIVGDTR